jgi:tetratricopeptide (TPR) repeat protein
MRERWIAGGLLLLLACTGPGGVSQRQVQQDIAEGRVEDAAKSLEKARDADPDSFRTRLALAEAYYLLAREALDEDREADYLSNIGKAYDELLAAAALDPESADAHLWMGIIQAYQNDIDAALVSFGNARRLEPRVWVHTTNLAETWIYAGNVARARTLLDKGRKQGAPAAVIELNQMLAAWRQGDYVEARDIFEGLYALNPQIIRTWNEAPVDDPIESFEDFTGFCCGHIACGPYMADACKEMKLEVKQRHLEEETLRKEIELARERRKRLREIYEDRGDLGIRVEDEE